MVQIIAGEKGKGKTKILLDKVNSSVENSKGTIVYIDKNTKHMYELNRDVRLINIKDFAVENRQEFVGFICGIISQDHDLQKIYLDSFLNVACIENKVEEIVPVVERLDMISAMFNIDFILSVSVSAEVIPDIIKDKIIVSL